MIIVFDLDDTLYEESTFVRSGMNAVAHYLASILKTNEKEIYQELISAVQKNRDNVFDRILIKYGKESKKLIKECISVYRSHAPNISLHPSALSCLKRLKQHHLYVVTDGNKLVQKRKFISLGLETFIKHCFCTYAHGIHRSKPSPYCFEEICKWEGCGPTNIVYVADNPHKDFVGIKPLGYRTVRLLQGPYANVKVNPRKEAEFSIQSLNELDDAFLDQLQNNSLF